MTTHCTSVFTQALHEHAYIGKFTQIYAGTHTGMQTSIHTDAQIHSQAYKDTGTNMHTGTHTGFTYRHRTHAQVFTHRHSYTDAHRHTQHSHTDTDR